MATLKYVLNKSKQYKNGEYLIYLRVNFSKSRRYVSMKKRILLNYWDEKKGCVIVNSKLKEENRLLKLLNIYLLEKMSLYKRLLMNLEIEKPNFTIDDVVSLVDNKECTSVSIRQTPPWVLDEYGFFIGESPKHSEFFQSLV